MSVARKGIASYLANSVSNKWIENRTTKSRHMILSNNDQQLTTNEKFCSKNFKKSESSPFHFTSTFEFAASLHLIIQNDNSQPQTRRQKMYN